MFPTFRKRSPPQSRPLRLVASPKVNNPPKNAQGPLPSTDVGRPSRLARKKLSEDSVNSFLDSFLSRRTAAHPESSDTVGQHHTRATSEVDGDLHESGVAPILASIAVHATAIAPQKQKEKLEQSPPLLQVGTDAWRPEASRVGSWTRRKDMSEHDEEANEEKGEQNDVSARPGTQASHPLLAPRLFKHGKTDTAGESEHRPLKSGIEHTGAKKKNSHKQPRGPTKDVVDLMPQRRRLWRHMLVNKQEVVEQEAAEKARVAHQDQMLTLARRAEEQRRTRSGIRAAVAPSEDSAESLSIRGENCDGQGDANGTFSTYTCCRATDDERSRLRQVHLCHYGTVTSSAVTQQDQVANQHQFIRNVSAAHAIGMTEHERTMKELRDRPIEPLPSRQRRTTDTKATILCTTTEVGRTMSTSGNTDSSNKTTNSMIHDTSANADGDGAQPNRANHATLATTQNKCQAMASSKLSTSTNHNSTAPPGAESDTVHRSQTTESAPSNAKQDTNATRREIELASAVTSTTTKLTSATTQRRSRSPTGRIRAANQPVHAKLHTHNKHAHRNTSPSRTCQPNTATQQPAKLELVFSGNPHHRATRSTANVGVRPHGQHQSQLNRVHHDYQPLHACSQSQHRAAGQTQVCGSSGDHFSSVERGGDLLVPVMPHRSVSAPAAMHSGTHDLALTSATTKSVHGTRTPRPEDIEDQVYQRLREKLERNGVASTASSRRHVSSRPVSKGVHGQRNEDVLRVGHRPHSAPDSPTSKQSHDRPQMPLGTARRRGGSPAPMRPRTNKSTRAVSPAFASRVALPRGTGRGYSAPRQRTDTASAHGTDAHSRTNWSRGGPGSSFAQDPRKAPHARSSTPRSGTVNEGGHTRSVRLRGPAMDSDSEDESGDDAALSGW